MLFSLEKKIENRRETSLLIIPFVQKEDVAQELCLVEEWKEFYSVALENKDFTAKLKSELLVYGKNNKEKRCLLLGLGKFEEVTKDKLRDSFAVATNFCIKNKIADFSIVVPKEFSEEEGFATAILEGVILSNYVVNKLSTSEDGKFVVTKVNIISDSENFDSIIRKVETIADGVFMVRDLVNANADEVTPVYMEAKAREVASKNEKISITVFDKQKIQEEQMGLLYAVGRAAKNEPRFIVLSYKNNPSEKEHTVLVGKGVTYDTGGLDLKPGDNMLTMREDMAGAALVLGVLSVVASLNLPINVTAVMPCAENAIGSSSYKMGDVYRGKNGKTVEITSTDAEGRLILADALTYATENLEPTRIIDFATLTGAIVIALGSDIAGVFSNDDTLSQQLSKSANNTDELIHRMPLHKDYADLLKSDCADMKNTGGRCASSMTAALFLEKFLTKKVAWAHMDIAGTAFDTKKSSKAYLPKLATGFGVRLIVDFLSNN